MKELTVDAKIDCLDAVMTFVGEAFEELGGSAKSVTRFVLAADESFTNVASYAYRDMASTGDPLFGKALLRAESLEREGIPVGMLTLVDAGRPYDPLARRDPDITLSAEERQPGGLGIFMTKKVMDRVQYCYENGRNVLIMYRRL